VNPAPRWLSALFVLAVTGVLASVGAILGRAIGPVAVAAYVIVLAALVAAGARVLRRRLQAAARRAAGHTCTCCTGTVHDPVQVV
jgi:hypothetical protein